MKKIINAPETVVIEMCNGIALAHPELEFVKKFKIVKKKVVDQNKVSLISGGGSGHEPAHAGFIGLGMLDAAVCGDVFASPSQIQIYQAIKATASKKGTLLIIKNYSGDMMNFKNAAFLAKEDGIEVDYVKVDDDIAVQNSLYTVGRRGVAGTVLVHKIAGAAAQQGKSLAQVKAVAQKTVANVRSIGFAFTSCTVPAKGSPTFDIGENEIEYGVGIHGEPGVERVNHIPKATELAKRMVTALLADLKISATDKEEICVLVNGFGGTPLQELYLLNNAVRVELAKTSCIVARTFVGNYMTSIDMAGASVSILKLDKELKDLLSEKSDTPGFKVDGPSEVSEYVDVVSSSEEIKSVSYKTETDSKYAKIGNELTLNNMIYIIDRMSESIIENEIPFCELDSHAGDGDFGMSVAKGFKQLKREWKELVSESKNIGEFLGNCSIIIMEYCGGASGPIWGSAFRAASKQADNAKTLTLQGFADIMQAAVVGIQATGERSFGRGAVVGDKTLIDALVPCADSLSTSAKAGEGIVAAILKSAAAAVDGAEKTKTFAANMGRAGTVGDRSIGWPDAGAFGLGVIFTDIANSLK